MGGIRDLTGEAIKVTYSSSISNIEEINPSFSIGRMLIAYAGKNRNKSSIPKKSFEKAIASMYNCPVVAHYDKETNTIGSHDQEFIEIDGEDVLINLTEPVGVVPQFAKWKWETIVDNGVEHEYLSTDILLWKRQQAYDKIVSGDIIKQSMEINVVDGKVKGDYYEISDFYFTAFCLLGSAEPCFESARIFSAENIEESKKVFDAEYKVMLNEFKTAFADVNVVEKEGMKETMNKEKFKKLLEAYNVKVEDILFEYETLSDADLEVAFKKAFEEEEKPKEEKPKEEEPKEEEKPKEEEPEEEEKPKEEEPEEFKLSSNILDAIYEILSQYKLEDEYGAWNQYYLVDTDLEIKKLYVLDYLDFKLYGIPFKMDNDEVIVSFEKKARMKYEIVEYVEGVEVEGGTDFSEVYKTVSDELVKRSTARHNEEYQKLQSNYNSLQKSVDDEAIKVLFDRYSSLLKDNEEYATLINEHSDFSVDSIEEKLNAIYGKQQAIFAFKAESKIKKVSVIDSSDSATSDEPYGSMMNYFKKNGGNK